MATLTATELKARALQDARVLTLKKGGSTWKAIALEMGWGWAGTNMDGGRGKRAYLRAEKAAQEAAAKAALEAAQAKPKRVRASRAKVLVSA